MTYLFHDTPSTQYYHCTSRIQLPLVSPRVLLYIGYSIPIDLLLVKSSLRVECYPNCPGYTTSSSLYGNLMNIVWD